MTNKQTGSRAVSIMFLWCFCFLLFAGLYFFTAQRGISWQDSGLFQWRILNADYAGNLGLALAHPLYIFMGRFFLLLPFKNELFVLNLCSGVGMAIALANIAALVVVLTGNRIVAFMTVTMLSVMHTVWWLATIAEVYAWHAAFMSGELLLLIGLIRLQRPWLAYMLLLLNGLNLCFHNLALLAFPVYWGTVWWLVIQRRLPRSAVWGSLAAFVLGAGVYLTMVIHEAVVSGSLVKACLSALFGGYQQQVLNVQAQWNFRTVNAGLLSLNFVNACLPLAVVGWLCMRQMLEKAEAALLILMTVLYSVFALRYAVPDQFTFFLPALLLIGVAAALGMAVLWDISVSWRYLLVLGCCLSVVCPPIIYANAANIMAAFDIEFTRDRERPFRDELKYWAVPWKASERSAERFATEAFKNLPPGSTILCDGTSYYPLCLHQTIYNAETTIELRKSLIIPGGLAAELSDYLKERPVFAVVPNVKIASVEGRECLEVDRAAGEILYRVRWKCP